jgi:two-component system NtrC family sensor kinase
MTPHTLGIRLILLVVASVSVVLAVYSFVSYRSTRSDLLGFLHRNVDQSSDLIARATHDGMLLNRLDEVQETIERLADGAGIAAIRVYDKRGAIVLSADQEEIGREISIYSDTCSSCHGRKRITDTALLEQSALARDPEDAEVLRHLRVVPNEASCADVACHASPQEERVLGVLDVEMSMAPVEATLRAQQSRVIWTMLVLILVIGSGSSVYIHRVIHRPVVALHAGTQRIAAGDLDTRIEVKVDNELGELARAFNRMAEDLSRAQLELTTWSQKLEEKVVEKTGQLQRAQNQVLQMEKMASLGKLSATVAHELNNPIGGMLNYCRLVQRELENVNLHAETREDVDRFLRLIQEECVRCGRIVTNLLLFARPFGAQTKPVDLNEIVDRSLMLIAHHLHVSDIELKAERLVGNAQLIADPGQIQQALVALLINAVEAMDGPGGHGGTLSVRLAGNESMVSIEISDTGVGIPEDAVPRIFEPFFSTKDAQSGVGLGLAVVYGIVRRHGGKIEVESALGHGTTFHVMLPRILSPQPEDIGPNEEREKSHA